MKTDGYVKVNGQELSIKLAPNIDKLMYLIDWQDAIYMDQDIKTQKIRDQINAERTKNLQYLKNQSAKDVADVYDELTGFSLFKRFYNYLFLSKDTIPFDESIFKKKLMAKNENFWSKHFTFLEMCDYNTKRFINNFSGCFGEMIDYRFHRFHRFVINNHRVLYNDIKPFTDLKGDVFLSIDNYNFLNRFVNMNFENYKN